MGCEQSSVPNHNNNDISQLRRDKKKKPIVHGRSSGQIKLYENVKKIEDAPSSKEKDKIFKIISKHFFFSGFSHSERQQLIDHFSLFQCTDRYVFKQRDPGSLFFIIKKGKVSIQINNKFIKSLTKNQCFGDLSLLYTAPRSASVKVQQQCTFWCLHQISFRSFSAELAARNYKIAKPLLSTISIFKFMTKNQLNSLIYAANCEKYDKNKVIFKIGDDANSFYTIVQGSVKIQIPEKDPVWLEKGQFFGENSFKPHEIRSGTAMSGPAKTVLISISRQGLIKALGSQKLTQITNFNILRWSLVRSKMFRNIPPNLIPKIAKISEITEYSDNEIILKKKQQVKHFYIAIEGQINQFGVGQLVNEDYYINENQFELSKDMKKKDSKIVCKESLKKNGKGTVFSILIRQLQSLLQLDFKKTLSEKMRLFDDGEGIQFGEQYKPKTLKALKSTKSTKSIKNKSGKDETKKITLKTLNYICKLGQGQFGKVFLVEHPQTSALYALKCVKKKQIIEFGMQAFVRNQKEILEEINHPLIVKIYKTFKDDAYIYLLMEYIQGSDFFDVLREIGICSSSISKFYMACLILTIEQLHTKNVIYRDLKPENAVIDKDGFLKLIDMGAAKKLSESNGYRTFTIIGTPHYMAPEIIQGKGYSFESDIWSLGIILYEMVCGKLPFGDNQEDPYLIYQKIMQQAKIDYPNFYTNKKGKKLIDRLLDFNSSRRHLQNFKLLKNHPYFQGLDWDQVKNHSMKAPYKPKRKNKNVPTNKKSYNVCMDEYLAQQVQASKISKEETPWDKYF